MSTTANTSERHPSELAELNRQQTIALHAWQLTADLQKLLTTVGQALSCDDVWLVKGRITSYADIVRDLAYRL